MLANLNYFSAEAYEEYGEEKRRLLRKVKVWKPYKTLHANLSKLGMKKAIHGETAVKLTNVDIEKMLRNAKVWKISEVNKD